MSTKLVIYQKAQGAYAYEPWNLAYHTPAPVPATKPEEFHLMADAKSTTDTIANSITAAAVGSIADRIVTEMDAPPARAPPGGRRGGRPPGHRGPEDRVGPPG